MSDRLEAKNWNLLKLQRYQQSNHDALVRLGMETWESAKLKGTLYDFDTPIDEFLRSYAGQFDTVEYKHSFVDVPSERRMRELKSEVAEINKDFKFCPVIPRRVSHEFALGENLFDLQEFTESVGQLEEHLGPCILRLPETFSPQMMKGLFKFFKLWPKELRLSVNVTNEEWFRKTEALIFLAKEIEKTNVSILIEDRIERPMNVERLLSSDHLLVRFYGRPNLNQDEQRLAMWVYKLGEYKAHGVKNSHFFLYEEEEMCLSILRKMANSMGGNVRVPASYDVNSKQMGFQF